MPKKILVVEDDQDLVGLLKYNLEQEGFRVNYATDGSVAIPSIRKYLPDLLILDLMLPGMDGLEVCRQIRQSNKHMALPVLMLTARGEEADRVVGLELGADDYVTKPFSLRELIARVRALLRRREIFNLQTRVLQRTRPVHRPAISPGSNWQPGYRLDRSRVQTALFPGVKSRNGILARSSA